MEILDDEYFDLLEQYEEVKAEVKGSYKDFIDTTTLMVTPNDVVELIEYIKANPNASTSDILLLELKKMDAFLWENETSLLLELKGLVEVDSHNKKNRYFDYTVFEVEFDNGLEEYVMYLFEQMFEYGMIESIHGRDEANEIFSYDLEEFVSWMNSMYLTEKGYEYLEELKQKFNL